MGRPIMHFEIASPNLERAAAFYEELFDWDVGEEQMDRVPPRRDDRRQHRWWRFAHPKVSSRT